LLQGVRSQNQPGPEPVPIITGGPPQHPATQGLLEETNRPQRHRIHHLLVEMRIAFGRRPAVRGDKGGSVEINKAIVAVRWIDVVDHEVLTEIARNRPRRGLLTQAIVRP